MTYAYDLDTPNDRENNFISPFFFKITRLMSKGFTILFLLFFSDCLNAQPVMRQIDDLVNKKEPAWPLVKSWIDSATNKVEILPADSTRARLALYQTQVTTRSPMGAIIYETGGLLIDNGWIRILGSGSEKLNRSLPAWNKGKAFQEFGQPAPFLLIADDAIGGFFMLNGGGLGKDPGKVYYLSPDNLTYEPLDLTYTEFLQFCLNGDIENFYKDYRWPQLVKDLPGLRTDQVFSFFPYLLTKEGKDQSKVSISKISVDEQYRLSMDFRKQMGLDKQ